MSGVAILIRRSCEGALRWWLRELAAMIPARLRRWSASSGGVLLVTYENGLLAWPGAGESRTTAWTWRRSPRRQTGARRRARLRLATHYALRTEVQLPLAVESNLREVLTFELDRLTPFRADEVHLAHRVTARNEAAGKLSLDLLVVPRATVAEAGEAAAKSGFRIQAVEIADAGRPNAEPINFDDALPPSGRRFGALGRSALVAAVAAAATGLYLPMERLQETVDRLRSEVAAAQHATSTVESTRQRIAALEAEERTLAAQRRAAVSATETLFHLTRLLPDDTWLVRLRLTREGIDLSGYSGSASSLIRLIEQSRLFATAKFDAPVVQDVATGRERFDISARQPERPTP